MAEKTTEGAAPANGASPKVTKMEAVRRSLAKLGNDAANKDIQSDVKQRFGLTMTTDHISTYKGEIRKKANAAKKPAGKAATPAKAAPPAKAPAPAEKALRLEDVLAVKELVGRVGAGQLRTLIAAFER